MSTFELRLVVWRYLGIQRQYPADALAEAINHQARTSRKFGGAKEQTTTVRLEAEDLDLSIGSGPTITGPGLEILMVLTGRPPDLMALSGPGLTLIDA